MVSKTSKRPRRTAPLLVIQGGTKDTKALDILAKVALRATENGREAVAIEALKQITALSEVKHVTITNSSFIG